MSVRVLAALATAVVAMAVSVSASGCGGETAAAVAPSRVPDGLVPPTVQGGAFTFYESTLPAVKDAFANAGPKSMAADGRMWELRTGDRLVGALQLTTVLPEVDLANEDHRGQILGQLLPTSRDELLVDEVTVWATTTRTKSIFLWFSQHMFALMTLKGGTDDNLEPETILGDVIAHNVSSDSWEPLYLDDAEVDL